MKIRLTVGAAVLGALVATTGCGQDEPATSDKVDKIDVVASTNVWGSVAAAVGGDLIEVKSIISDPAGDPHSYQMTPADAAALTGADLVVFNGGGYDEFVEEALGDTAGRPMVEAFALFESDEHAETTTSATAAATTTHEDEHGHAENEHVWYRLDTVADVADDIAKRLKEIRPESGEAFQANADSFKDKINNLSTRVDQLAEDVAGQQVVATEPLAFYLLEQAGFEDVTPAEFVEAIEEETDPPAAAVAEIQNLVAQGQVALVVHNPQTETPVVADVLAKAQEAKLPIVEMTETLPAGQDDYVTWMTGQVEDLSAAATG